MFKKTKHIANLLIPFILACSSPPQTIIPQGIPQSIPQPTIQNQELSNQEITTFIPCWNIHYSPPEVYGSRKKTAHIYRGFNNLNQFNINQVSFEYEEQNNNKSCQVNLSFLNPTNRFYVLNVEDCSILNIDSNMSSKREYKSVNVNEKRTEISHDVPPKIKQILDQVLSESLSCIKPAEEKRLTELERVRQEFKRAIEESERIESEFPEYAACLKSGGDCPMYVKNHYLFSKFKRTPQSAKIEPIRKAKVDYPKLYFETDKYILSKENIKLLEQIVTPSLCQADVTTIAGHADERGEKEYNQNLSLRRAKNVSAYFIDLCTKISAKPKVQVISFGEEKPIIVGLEETVLKQNRRVEIWSDNVIISSLRRIEPASVYLIDGSKSMDDKLNGKYFTRSKWDMIDDSIKNAECYVFQEKKGIISCKNTSPEGGTPLYNGIEAVVKQMKQEHLVVFTDGVDTDYQKYNLISDLKNKLIQQKIESILTFAQQNKVKVSIIYYRDDPTSIMEKKVGAKSTDSNEQNLRNITTNTSGTLTIIDSKTYAEM